MTTWAPTESRLVQLTEHRTWTHPDCLLPYRYDTGWERPSEYVTDIDTRARIMRRERDAGRAPNADGWLYYGRKTLDYPNDGLKLLIESRIRWEWT